MWRPQSRSLLSLLLTCSGNAEPLGTQMSLKVTRCHRLSGQWQPGRCVEDPQEPAWDLKEMRQAKSSPGCVFLWDPYWLPSVRDLRLIHPRCFQAALLGTPQVTHYSQHVVVTTSLALLWLKVEQTPNGNAPTVQGTSPPGLIWVSKIPGSKYPPF